MTGDLRLTGLRPVGAGQIASSEGWASRAGSIPPSLTPIRAFRKGRDSCTSGSYPHFLARTLPERGTQTVLEVTVETTRPVLEGVPVGGRIEWREHMWDLTGAAGP